MSKNRTGRSFPFEYYVFESREREPTDRERATGIYLVGQAEAFHLEQFFEALYDNAGIGIDTSEDEIISGKAALTALADTIDAAIRDVEQRPGDWPVTVGHSIEPFKDTPGPPIVRLVSRSRLLDFLKRIAVTIVQARDRDGHIHFGGGG